MKIQWSRLAERQLKEIFDYYSREATPRIAEIIVNDLIRKVSVLKQNPLVGMREELLRNYPEEYRYLVVRNYKIIYWKSQDNIIVATVFDCRQNPKKIKHLKS